MNEREMLELRIGLLEDSLVVGAVGDGCRLLARRHIDNLKDKLKKTNDAFKGQPVC